MDLVIVMLSTAILALGAPGPTSSIQPDLTDGIPEAWGSPGLHAAPTASDTSHVRILQVAPQGNEARYRVRERLAALDFPNDAVGRTSAIQGRVVVRPDGSVDRDASRIVIDMASLQSDQDRRDNFLRRNTLETDGHPTLILIPIALRGLPNPLPTAGDHNFLLVAEMVLKGEAHPTTWEVQATFVDGAVLGRASTILTFDGLGLEKPRVRSVLSVADDIRLEYDFRLVPGEEG